MKNADHKKIGRLKKKHRQLCLEMQIRGWVIYFLAFFWDFIATKLTFHHASDVGWGQVIVAFYGLWLVWIGERAK